MSFLSRRIARSGLLLAVAASAAQAQFTSPSPYERGEQQLLGTQNGPFRRIASFPVFLNTSVEDETVAEIVASADRGRTLIYTDSEGENVGFVDISDPANPQPAGIVDLGGEPTSVGVRRAKALVCVNTSADFVNTSGHLTVINVLTKEIEATIDLGGQPDAIAISPDGQWAAVAIENERDEDLGSGEPPQLPAGFLQIIRLQGEPSTWTATPVDLTGICELFPEDPEPEFVDINALNLCAVTMQENNHCAIVYLPTATVITDFSFGTVDLEEVDVLENDLIQQNASLRSVPREPDAVSWTSLLTLSTADEGDLFGGSRGFTNWTVFGTTLFEAGNSLEHEVARVGHYPEGRSENKGNEPEAVEYGSYQDGNFLFVGSERSNLVLVYELVGNDSFLANSAPLLRQVLPTGVAPEGLVAIPNRNLFVVANEDDARDDKIRSTIMIYELTGDANYPHIVSDNRQGTEQPIPWAALSGLATGPAATVIGNAPVYAIYDSFYVASRIFTLDVSSTPAVLTDELALNDDNGVLLGAYTDLKALLPGTDDFDPASLIAEDSTVILDPEGIDTDGAGGWWVASEGRGNLLAGVSDPEDRPFEYPNALIRVAGDGTITDVVLPPLEVTQNQLRFGFEGVAQVGDALYVAFQRAWQAAGDPADRARIGRYDLNSGEWSFAYYPLSAPTSPNGGWVGLSELTHLGGDDFGVIERDNQGGPDAAIKHITRFSIAGIQFQPAAAAPNFDVLRKSLVSDLIADDAYAFTGGPLPEKMEGLTVLPDGTALIVNDNDGVDDNNGETVLLRLEELFD